jgi:hypothetical protein
MSTTAAPNSRSRWFDAFSLLVGLWVFVCPWVISDVAPPPIALSMHIAGALAVLIAAYALVRPAKTAEVALLVVAGWLIVAPWAIGFGEDASRQSVFYGVILAGSAGILLFDTRRAGSGGAPGAQA